MAYNRRDLFAHWVRRDQPTNRPCTHACCRGYRSHPEGYPVTLPARVLRGASDDQLARHYAKCPAGAPRCRDQVLHELHRRDVAQERQEATEERRRLRWQASQRAKQERNVEIERHYVAAEAATKGNMLNRRGREAGINERSLFRGPESRVRKYGSEELLNYFEENPRPTEAFFAGQESRMGYYSKGPRKRMTSQEQRERDYYERLEAEEAAR